MMKIALIAIVITSALIVAGNALFREREGSKEFHPRHVVLQLDPSKIKTEISKDEAVEIIENIGYTPLNPNIRLMEAKDWGKALLGDIVER